MAEPELIYSSNQHGISLTTFYTRSEKYEPTILVIKTTEKEVFGAYCSTTWATRNEKDDQGRRQHYFGTGETFLFTFATGIDWNLNFRAKNILVTFEFLRTK